MSVAAAVAVEALSLTLGAFRLKKIDFKLARGEILVILGPNGAGKSATLETIAGFHQPDSGGILLGGRDVTALPPEQRRVGFVVQNFGLFPHLSVARNVAIARRTGRAAAAHDAGLPPHGDPAALLSYFGIMHLADRAPAQLSAGEKQRVALARALASAPDLFLFDEPFSALDTETRDQLREELKSFLRALAIPAIFVTHDHDDALALADAIVVLRDGAIVQSGSAAEIFKRPANSFVARFVGVENILPGQIVGQSAGFFTLAAADHTLRAAQSPNAVSPGASVLLAIRAEDVTIMPARVSAESPDAFNRLQGRVIGTRTIGPLVAVRIDCGFQLKAYLLAPQWRAMKLGQDASVVAEIAPDAIHLMRE
jgi:ABC-type Fe3+/spermidine/putrescine transport system ATPase subunit